MKKFFYLSVVILVAMTTSCKKNEPASSYFNEWKKYEKILNYTQSKADNYLRKQGLSKVKERTFISNEINLTYADKEYEKQVGLIITNGIVSSVGYSKIVNDFTEGKHILYRMHEYVLSDFPNKYSCGYVGKSYGTFKDPYDYIELVQGMTEDRMINESVILDESGYNKADGRHLVTGIQYTGSFFDYYTSISSN